MILPIYHANEKKNFKKGYFAWKLFWDYTNNDPRILRHYGIMSIQNELLR